jgi:hypothetical protein
MVCIRDGGVPSYVQSGQKKEVIIHLVLTADENPLLKAESNPFSLCKAAGLSSSRSR